MEEYLRKTAILGGLIHFRERILQVQRQVPPNLGSGLAYICKDGGKVSVSTIRDYGSHSHAPCAVQLQ